MCKHMLAVHAQLVQAMTAAQEDAVSDEEIGEVLGSNGHS